MNPLPIAWVFAVVAAAPPASDGQVMRALRDEVARAKEQLALPGMERPYHILAEIEDEDHRSLAASLGALTRDEGRRSRSVRVIVRVGSPALDNGNFFSMNLMSGERTRFVPYEDDYDAIRRQLWLTIDAAYKEALEALAQKRAALKAQAGRDSRPADFSAHPPSKLFVPSRPPREMPDLRERLRRAGSDRHTRVV